MKELKKRIFTAFAAAGVLFAALWAGTEFTGLFVGLASAIALYEFGGIVFHQNDRILKRWTLVLLGVMVFGFKSSSLNLPELSLGFVLLSVFFLIIARSHSEADSLKVHVFEWFAAVAGMVYLGSLPAYLVKLRALESGLEWCLLLFFVVIASDTTAFFVGKTIGKNKLYPLVSPKKSVEGFLGGIIGSVLTAGIYGRFALQQYSIVQILALGLILGLIAPVGDLVESLLKRGFDVKDAGGILPGHGGVLDRADSVVFSAPVMYAGVKLLIVGG